MKVYIYFLRVMFISFEFLLIVISLICYSCFTRSINEISSSLSISTEVLIFAAGVPVLLSGWIFKHIKQILFPNNELIFIQKYPQYWEFKIHYRVTLIYTVFFLLIALIPLVFGFDIKSAKIFVLVLTGYTGLAIVALSVYIGDVNLNELLNKYK